jgi:hypothetical protein
MLADWEKMSADIGAAIEPITNAWNHWMSSLANDLSAQAVRWTFEQADDRLERMGNAFESIRKSGRLTTETMGEMISAGFNPSAVIMERMNWNAGKFQDERAAGRVSVDMVADAMQKAAKYNEILAESEGITLAQFEARAEKERKVQFERERAAAKMLEMETAREEMRKAGMFSMPQLQFDVLKEAGAFKDDDLTKLERYTSLMDEATKSQAIADFAMHKNLFAILGMLDKQLQNELEQLDVMEQKALAAKKYDDLLESSRKLNEQLTTDPIVEKLAELEVARFLGAMSQETFDKAQRQAVAGAGGNVPSTTLASSINANSQEAYQFIVGAQDRQAKEQMKKIQEQVILQQKSLKAQERANELLDEIADNAVGAA